MSIRRVMHDMRLLKPAVLQEGSKDIFVISIFRRMVFLKEKDFDKYRRLIGTKQHRKKDYTVHLLLGPDLKEEEFNMKGDRICSFFWSCLRETYTMYYYLHHDEWPYPHPTGPLINATYRALILDGLEKDKDNIRWRLYFMPSLLDLLLDEMEEEPYFLPFGPYVANRGAIFPNL